MSKIIKLCNIMIGITGACIICMSTDAIASWFGIVPKGTTWMIFPLAFILSKGMVEKDTLGRDSE